MVVAVRRVVVEDGAAGAGCPEAEAGRRVRQAHNEALVRLDHAVSLHRDRDRLFGFADRESDAARRRAGEIGCRIGRRGAPTLQVPAQGLLRRAGGVQLHLVGEHRRAAVAFELLGDVGTDRYERAQRAAAEEFADRLAAVGKDEDLHLADGIGAADGAVEVEADVFGIGIGVAAVGAGENDAVEAVAAVEQVVAEAGDEHVVTVAAEQAVVAGAAVEPVGQRIAGDLIGRRTADRILDVARVGDGDVVRHAVAGRERARRQVDRAVRVPAAEVERIDASGVVDGQDRIGVEREVEDRRHRAADVAAEAIDRVAGASGRVGAVGRLDGKDVVEHRRLR